MAKLNGDKDTSRYHYESISSQDGDGDEDYNDYEAQLNFGQEETQRWKNTNGNPTLPRQSLMLKKDSGFKLNPAAVGFGMRMSVLLTISSLFVFFHFPEGMNFHYHQTI